MSAKLPCKRCTSQSHTVETCAVDAKELSELRERLASSEDNGVLCTWDVLMASGFGEVDDEWYAQMGAVEDEMRKRGIYGQSADWGKQ